jgi:hypothetical protein
MIGDYQSQGKASGVELVCDKKCLVLSGLGDKWEAYLSTISDSIVFVDEGERYVSSKEFARCISKTNNYYVIATRNNLYDIPYSVDAIYEIKTSGKYGKLRKTYNSFKRLYGDLKHIDAKFGDCKKVIVEDSKSGYQFYKKVCENFSSDCITSGGKSGIFSLAEKYRSGKMLIVADGAAFGSEMANVYGLVEREKCDLFLPESFEWLILNSGIIADGDIKQVLENPSDHIESEKYFSWELFFTAYLVEKSRGMEYRYSKSVINEYYLSDRNVKRILGGFFTDI